MWEAIIVGSLSVALFAAIFAIIGILKTTSDTLSISAAGVEALTSDKLDDDAKEEAVQKAGIQLLGKAFGLIWRISACLLAAAIPVYAADWLGLSSVDNSLAMLLNPIFLIASTIAAIVLIGLLSGGKTWDDGDTASDYSQSEKIVHMMAFIPGFQKAMFGLDNIFFNLFGRKPEKGKTVFITSLARGGTTACLNAMYSLDSVATNTYRDMPFITMPFLWNGLSSLMGRKTERHERAHGDGMEIDLESPEAFDEIYWKLWWKDHYRADTIQPWTADDAKPAATQKLARAFTKIISARGKATRHYVSKNNANVARIALLKQMFPDCTIIVPMRRPSTHAASLYRQHLNFLKQQEKDSFTKRYMEDIGHFEFGQAHRPILFDGFDPKAFDPMTPDYWLAYWIAGFEQVQRDLAHADIVLQDEFRNTPDAIMRAILNRAGIESEDGADFTRFFRQSPDTTDESVFDPNLLAKANALYEDIATNRQKLLSS